MDADEPRPAAHLHLLEHWVVLNAGEEHPHGIRPVVEEGDASTIQVIGQLVDVRLQLCKSYGQTRNQGRCPTGLQAPRPPLRTRLKPWLCCSLVG